MLIDDLLYFCNQTHDPSNLDDGLMMAVRFQIDNVARYAYDTHLSTSGIGQMLKVEDRIPNVAPLAPVMWFEFGGLAKGDGKPATNRYGCLLSVDYDRKGPQVDERDAWYASNIADETRWILRSQCFGKLSSELVLMNWIHYVSVAEDGHFVDLLARERSNLNLTPESVIPKADFYNESLVALFAICFAHCKGATIEEHQPSRQVRRAAERAGKPIFSFHTIDIEPSKQVLRTEGHINENGIAKALHICRGHFAHYTAEKPLFGKYTGTFYRPMHVRGKLESGIVAKDYRVHPQKETAEARP